MVFFLGGMVENLCLSGSWNHVRVSNRRERRDRGRVGENIEREEMSQVSSLPKCLF